MPQYQSTHTGAQIDTAVTTVQDVIDTTGTYAATSSNKVTTVSQVQDLIEDAIIDAIDSNY